MIQKKEYQLKGKDGRPVMVDVQYREMNSPIPVVVFAHGFKGFKDWGTFNAMARWWAEKGYACVKFNFSHNGVTPAQPLDFADLEAFGENTITKELNDLDVVLDWVFEELESSLSLDLSSLALIGFSRGGGTTLIKASEDDRIQRIVSWASIAGFKGRFPDDIIEHWRREGVLYIPNARTQQQMPLYKTLLEDFEDNEERLDVERAVKGLHQPYLIVQGKADETVLPAEAEQLKSWCSHAILKYIEDAGHTFNGKHPWEDNQLPVATQQLLQITLDFLHHC